MENKELEISGNKNTNLIHPISALVTIFVDLIFFGVDAATLGLDLPVSVTAAFVITFVSVILIQLKLSKNNFIQSLTKAFILGVLAAVPTPIAGTLIGTLILAAAGIKKLKN